MNTHRNCVCARNEEDYKAFIERWFPAKERGLWWWEKSECFCWHLNNGEHAAVMRLSPADRRPCVWLQWNVGAVSHETKLLDRCWARLWRKTQCSIFPLHPLFNNRIFFFSSSIYINVNESPKSCDISCTIEISLVIYFLLLCCMTWYYRIRITNVLIGFLCQLSCRPHISVALR